jgi:hypothetical protein
MRKLMRELMHVAHELGPPAPRRYRGLHAAVFLTTRPPRGRSGSQEHLRRVISSGGTGRLVAEGIGVRSGTEAPVDGMSWVSSEAGLSRTGWPRTGLSWVGDGGLLVAVLWNDSNEGGGAPGRDAGTHGGNRFAPAGDLAGAR